MKNNKKNLIILAAGIIAVTGGVWAHQAAKSKTAAAQKQATRTASAPKVSYLKSLPPQANGEVIAVDIEPGANAAYQAAERPIAALEERTRLLMHQGDWKGAEQVCLQAIAARAAQSEPISVAFARNMLGEIYLREGQYQKCIETYLPNYKYTRDASMNLNVALAYARLGDYEAARRYYSDQAMLKYSPIKPEDLPGTGTPQSLEASILMAKGLNEFFSSEKQDALNDLDVATKLAPRNGLIPYYAGMSLIHMERGAEAEPYFQKAAHYGRGKMAEEARRRVFGIVAWNRLHPARK